MNYYDARERKDGGWLYSCADGDARVWTVGHCVDHRDQPHATQLEAYECYTRFLLDTRLRLDLTDTEAQRHCEAPGCGTWTQGMARVGAFITYHLCDEHRTREVVAGLLGTVGASMSSW